MSLFSNGVFFDHTIKVQNKKDQKSKVIPLFTKGNMF